MINKIIELALIFGILFNVYVKNIQVAILLGILLILKKVSNKNDS